MKRIMLVVAMVMLAGCAHRSGSVCVTPTVTEGFDTQNPIEVKQDTADIFGKKITSSLKKNIADSHFMNLVLESDCEKANFSLHTTMIGLDTGASPSVVFDSTRTFDIILNGRLEDNKTQKNVVAFSDLYASGEMKDTIEYLSRQVVEEIR
jgi:hypothetical protein